MHSLSLRFDVGTRHDVIVSRCPGVLPVFDDCVTGCAFQNSRERRLPTLDRNIVSVRVSIYTPSRIHGHCFLPELQHL